MSASAILCGLAAELGDILPISDLAGPAPHHEQISELEEMGLRTFSCMGEGVLDAVTRCVASTLDSAQLLPQEIKAVMFVTEAFTAVTDSCPHGGESLIRFHRNALADAVAAAGVVNVPTFCSTYGGSSNLLQGIFLIKHVVEFTKCTPVLVVCVDRVPPGTARWMDAAVALTGDGVASCILTAGPVDTKPALKIEHVGITPYATAGAGNDWSRLIVEMYRATKYAAADCYEALGLQPDDYAWLIAGNYNLKTSQVFTRLLGFDDDRSFTANVALTGHLPSADPLLNLRDLTRLYSLTEGARILVYCNGPISCGVMSFLVV